MLSDLNPIEPLTRDHCLKSFVAGVSAVDNYLHDRALADIEKGCSRVFVLTLSYSPETIVGYYSLASLAVPIDGIATTLRKSFPSHDDVLGTTRLAKLAVAEDYQRHKCALRLGEHLLLDAMLTAWVASRQVASSALVADVLVGEKGDPTTFYTKNNFIPYESQASRLFLPMSTIEHTLRIAGIID